jgi:protein O-mannosyl-transferase
MQAIYEKISSMRIRTVVLILIFVGLLTYGNVLKGPFLWDDKDNVTGNVFITDWKYLPKYFSENLFAGANVIDDYWRPLEVLSFSFDYYIGGLSPVIYHLDTLAWHILAAILLYIVLLKLFKNKLACFLTAFVFLIHPLQIESAAYISGRADPMSAVFLLASFWLFWKYVNEKPRLINISASVVFFVLALLSHERAVVFPAIIVLYFFTLYQKQLFAGWKKKSMVLLPFLIIDVLYIISRLTIFHFSNSFDVGAISFVGNPILADLKAITIYAGLLVFPAKLYMEKTVAAPASFFDGYVIAGTILVLASAIGFFISLRKKRIFAFFIGWFWIFLSLSLYAYPSMGMLWEHWLYLPMISLWMAFFLAVTKKIDGSGSVFAKNSIVIIVFIFMAALLIRTIVRNNDWKNPISFFEKNIALGGVSERIYNELGTAYQNDKKYEDALSAYQKSIELNDQLFQPWYNMGTIYEYEGDLDQAKSAYSRVIQIKPSFFPAYNALAEIAIGEKRFDNAITIYNEILEIYPQNIETVLNIGAVYFQKGEIEKAREYFEEAQRLDPENPDILRALNKLNSLKNNSSNGTE